MNKDDYKLMHKILSSLSLFRHKEIKVLLKAFIYSRVGIPVIDNEQNEINILFNDLNAETKLRTLIEYRRLLALSGDISLKKLNDKIILIGEKLLYNNNEYILAGINDDGSLDLLDEYRIYNVKIHDLN